MNKVTITLEISRANSGQCGIELFRTGCGDDMVEQRADQFEAVLKKAGMEMIAQDGGEVTHDESDQS